jgi:beta-lactamase regulating signal transducer with metallopeptidase domain
MITLLTSSVTPALAIYLLNLALASLLISAAGLLAAAGFRRQSAPVRHAILAWTVIFTLLLPGLIWWAGQNGWGLIRISFADAPPKVPVPESRPPAAGNDPVTDLPANGDQDLVRSDAALPISPFAVGVPRKTPPDGPRAVESVSPAPKRVAAGPEIQSANPTLATSWLHVTIALAAWTWLIGMLIGAAWVARGFVVLRRFRRSLETPAFDRIQKATREAAAAFGAERLPAIRVSAFAPAPLTLGLFKPLIVLPKGLAERIDAEQLRAILVHEAAHLAHYHHWIGLAQWLTGLGFWWNPLLRRVQRGILQLREEVCDDHVLQSRADGRDFARVLLDLAARLTDLPRVPATLAILETGYADLQRRITNLLDKERIIVTSMTRKATFSVFFCGLFIALIIPFAGLRADENGKGAKKDTLTAATAPRAATADAAESTAPSDKKPAGETTTPAASPLRSMRVRVIGLDGKPMAGALVHAGIWTDDTTFKHNRDYTCDADGRTVVELPKSLDILRLWAHKPHCVPLFMHWEEEWFKARNPLPEEFVFKLAKGATIGGLVTNEEGKPIAEARIAVECDDPRRDKREEMGQHPIVSSHLAEGRDVVSDANGRWSLDNVPADESYTVTINVNHPDYVSDYTWGAMQAAQGVTSGDLRRRKAKIVMHRGTVISGSVTDPKGRPVPGAVLAWGRDPYDETSGDQMFRHEVYTDAQGVYRLPPRPADNTDLRITVMAAGWAPNLKVVTCSGAKVPSVDFQLQAGRIVRFRFLDESGRPIPKAYVSIASWRGGQSLYNTKHPMVLDTRIPERADEKGIYEWTWAPDDEVRYSCGKPGYKYVMEAITADGQEHEIRLSKAKPDTDENSGLNSNVGSGETVGSTSAAKGKDSAAPAAVYGAAAEAGGSHLPSGVGSPPADGTGALKVLRANPPAKESERVAAAIEVIHSCRLGDENGYPAEYAIRELIRIGKPAVPKLIDELDKTDDNHFLRAAGFVLRGIGDPRAVPALIRAIPRLAQFAGSDCGYTIKNYPELFKFMQDHDNRKVMAVYVEGAAELTGEETMFSYGRPVNEIMPALQSITGQRLGWIDLVFSQLDKSAEQNRLKRLEFQKLADRWAQWWEKNWQKLVKDESEAQIAATRRVLAKTSEDLAGLAPQPMTEIPWGKDIGLCGADSFPSISSFDDPRALYRRMACIDLDTNRILMPPPELVKSSSRGKPSPQLLAWAEREGVELIGIRFQPPGSEKSYFGFQPVGMKVWRIENSRYDNLAKELQTSKKFDLPEPWEGLIASVNEKTGQIDEHQPASFLFITRKGICGALRIKSMEKYPMPKPGTPSSEFKSPFEYQFIYREIPGS